MAEIASWNGHKFVVQPKLIQSFEDLSIKGSCETTDKTSGGKKYVQWKSGDATQISFTVVLNALAGCSDVYGEAQKYVSEASSGAMAYFYLGSKKAIDAEMMLVSAEVQEVVTRPGSGEKWISCKVKLTMKQGLPPDKEEPASSGSSGGGDSGGSSTSSGGVTTYTAYYYYSGSSGAVQTVSATSTISYNDALSKAKALVPGTAMWSGSTKQSATQTQPTYSDAALEAARARAQGNQASTTTKTNTGLSAKVTQVKTATTKVTATVKKKT